MSRHSSRARAALLAAAVLALLAGCKEPPGSSLFPLEEGRRWTYRLSSEWENDTRERETVVLSNLGRDSVLESGSACHRRSDTGLDYWLRADATGIYRVAAKSDVDAEPKPDPTPRFVLKAPIAVGTSWQTTTTTYLMRRNSEFPPEIRHAHPSVPVVWTIEALDDRVEVPAGRFEQCVRVKGLALLRLFADPVNGFKDMPLTTQEWYCPGVGLVKVERREPANSTFLTGGTMTMELMEWQ